MSLNDVLEEIRPGCTRRKTKSVKQENGIAFITSGEEEVCDSGTTRGSEPDTEVSAPKPRRRRRTVKQDSPSTNTKIDACGSVVHGDIYNSKIVGEINIAGLDLLPGEKLVVVKLTPLVIK